MNRRQSLKSGQVNRFHTGGFAIFTHSANKPFVRDLLAKYSILQEGEKVSIKSPKILIEFRDEIPPSFHSHYKFPYHPLIEYEEKDIEWLEPLKMGRRVYDLSKPIFWGTLNGRPYWFGLEEIIKMLARSL